jgi:hypothetical protein
MLQSSTRAAYGYEPTREAAMAAFAKRLAKDLGGNWPFVAASSPAVI